MFLKIVQGQHISYKRQEKFSKTKEKTTEDTSQLIILTDKMIFVYKRTSLLVLDMISAAQLVGVVFMMFFFLLCLKCDRSEQHAGHFSV